MTSTLRYGADSSLRLELNGSTRVTHCDAPRGEPLVDVAGHVEGALREPLEFPPLGSAVLPDDKVVLALADGVPQAETIVARTVEALLAAGVEPRDLTLVHTAADAAVEPDVLGKLPAAIRSQINVRVHDPHDRGSLSYLAASAAGEPIYISRAIHDADMVITIGCLRLDQSLGYYGIHSSLFPTFSDAASQERYRAPKSRGPQQSERLRHDADEAGWLLGAQFTVQVVPGGGGAVLDVLAGETSAVVREGRRRCSAAWSYQVADRASLVVATIEGGPAEQTWENVARALASAAHAVRDDGAVAVCSELSSAPGPGLQRIAGAEDLDRALREIGRHKPDDALVAGELIRALERGKVYLLSKLDEATVEDLGILPLEPQQLSRLAARFDSCLVLSNAPYALAVAENERSESPPADIASFGR